MAGYEPESKETLLNLPPNPRQQKSALIAAAVLIFGLVAVIPFADVPLPRLDVFIPALAVAIFVTDFITSVQLFSHFSISGSRALLMLASGYLFTALMVILYALAFPGAFSPTGLFGASIESPPWLYVIWHTGFPLALLMYAWLKDEKHEKSIERTSTFPVIVRSVIIVIGLVCAFGWLSIVEVARLPRYFEDDSAQYRFTQFSHDVAVFHLLLCVFVFVVLWARRRSVLDLWLIIVTIAFFAEFVFSGLLSSARFSLGFYVGRIFSLITSTVVLAALLTETTRLYARLARTNLLLERERDNKLMNVQAITTAIAHEIRQPLGAITANAGAALRFLQKTPPDHEEVRAALNRIKNDSHQANEVFDSIRALFGKVAKGREQVDVNETIMGVLASLHGELQDHGVETHTELASELPSSMAIGQLREVIFNLVHNAIEAMDTTTDRSRVLRVKTALRGHDAIVVSVIDSGPGIDPEQMNSIFGAFVTTKAHGTGLGLAICRMIVEHQGGEISASSDGKNGTTFQFALPIDSTHKATARITH